jgi:hypothetical protein
MENKTSFRLSVCLEPSKKLAWAETFEGDSFEYWNPDIIQFTSWQSSKEEAIKEIRKSAIYQGLSREEKSLINQAIKTMEKGLEHEVREYQEWPDPKPEVPGEPKVFELTFREIRLGEIHIDDQGKIVAGLADGKRQVDVEKGGHRAIKRAWRAKHRRFDITIRGIVEIDAWRNGKLSFNGLDLDGKYTPAELSRLIDWCGIYRD